MLRAIDRAISLLSQLCFILSAAALFVIAAYGAADVAVAVAGGGGLPVTREASSVLLAAAVFLSFGYSQYRRQDIRVDVLIELCPSRVQRLSLLLSLILGIFVFAVLTWQSWELFLRSWLRSPSCGFRSIPRSWPLRSAVSPRLSSSPVNWSFSSAEEPRSRRAQEKARAPPQVPAPV